MSISGVLIDRGCIGAILNAESPDHARARAIYANLLVGYEARTKRLFALSTVLADIPKPLRKAALGPVLVTRVTGQHRRAAARIRTKGFDSELALSLVMIKRERIRAVATLSHDYDTFDIEVLFAGSERPLDEMPAGNVSYGTEPQPVRQSTDG